MYKAGDDLNDNIFIEKIKAGENSYLSELIEKYYDDIYRYCCYVTGNSTVSYDITQNTFLNLINSIQSYSEKNKFKGYLFSIAKNCCYDYFRQLHNYDELDEQVLPPGEDFTDSVNTSHLVQKALNSLPLFQRDTIILYFYYGFKIREIADITGATASTVKSRLKQGKGKLKDLLTEKGVNQNE